jgi:hypothetical protein
MYLEDEVYLPRMEKEQFEVGGGGRVEEVESFRIMGGVCVKKKAEDRSLGNPDILRKTTVLNIKYIGINLSRTR